MKKSMVILCAVLLVFGVVGTVNATLTTIGTATYGGSDYNLIYEDNQHLVWVDYTHGYNTWRSQKDWALGLNTTGVLTYNLNPGISISWVGDWRLPSTDESVLDFSGQGLYGGYGYQGPNQNGNYSYAWGYNMVNSEMGQLFYKSLGNKGYVATDGTVPQTGWGLTNTGPFNNLQGGYYYSGTEYSHNTGYAWGFLLGGDYGDDLDLDGNGIGGQYQAGKGDDAGYLALAVRPGDVSPVPEPSTMLLLGCGLIGLAGLTRKFKQ